MPEPARREAPRLLGAIAAGDDPLEDRKAAARTMTRAALCELYLAEGVGHKKSEWLRSSYAAGPQRRADGEASDLLCNASSVPTGRRCVRHLATEDGAHKEPAPKSSDRFAPGSEATRTSCEKSCGGSQTA